MTRVRMVHKNSNVIVMSHTLPPRCLYSSQVHQDKCRTCLHDASTGLIQTSSCSAARERGRFGEQKIVLLVTSTCDAGQGQTKLTAVGNCKKRPEDILNIASHCATSVLSHCFLCTCPGLLTSHQVISGLLLDRSQDAKHDSH